MVAVFYNKKKYYHLQCNTQGGCLVVLTKNLSFPSLRRRRNLTLVSNICEEEPISLFWAPSGLHELPFILIGKLTIAFLTGRLWRVVTSWYTDRAQNKDFDAVSQMDLTRVLQFRKRRRQSFPSLLMDYFNSVSQSLMKSLLMKLCYAYIGGTFLSLSFPEIRWRFCLSILGNKLIIFR